MPACSQIYLWMETLKYDALNKVVTKNNTTIEALLQPKLEELYCEYVPADLRKQIAEKLADILLEEEKAEHRKAERERKTVIKLCDVGVTWWLGHTTLSDLRIASLIRRALRLSPEDPASFFRVNLGAKCSISEDEFDSKTLDYLQGKTSATNSVILDFKDNTVTLAQPSVGHMIYRMSDVSTAAYHACRSQSRTEEEKERLFYKALAGKALQTIPWEEKSKDNENT